MKSRCPPPPPAAKNFTELGPVSQDLDQAGWNLLTLRSGLSGMGKIAGDYYVECTRRGPPRCCGPLDALMVRLVAQACGDHQCAVDLWDAVLDRGASDPRENPCQSECDHSTRGASGMACVCVLSTYIPRCFRKSTHSYARTWHSRALSQAIPHLICG